jgi:beta-D-xylosidase 4
MRVNLSEIPGLLNTDSKGVDRLGLAPTQWWSEGLHGVRCGHSVTCTPPTSTTTVFPEPIGSAASFNDSLWFAVGDAIATEFRVFSNIGKGDLSIFSPNINIFRDGRWGRGQETPGEDPSLSSRYAVAYVRGMQGNRST